MIRCGISVPIHAFFPQESTVWRTTLTQSAETANVVMLLIIPGFFPCGVTLL